MMAATPKMVVLCLVATLGCALTAALGSTPALSVDAGSAQVLCLPATDLSLFGHSSDQGDAPVAVQWSVVSGPGPVVFSGPTSLITTASFSATGSYVLRLSGRSAGQEAHSTVKVTVNPASSQRAFYVDPDYAGDGDGSASRPWTTLGTSPTNAQWNAINAALAEGPVIVYFSAREAGSDTPEETTQPINILRTDKSTNRLTIDGMSKYNTDDQRPSWAENKGRSRLRVRLIGGGSLAVGVTEPRYPMNHVTCRGFEATGDAARVIFGGNDSVMEYVYIHDIMKDGANLMFHGSVDSDGTELFGRCTDITIRNNLVERGLGEGIYFAGNYRLKSDGGWPEYGNTHSNILIEGNTIRDAGLNGGQGEGIDMKTGLRNVAIRNNVIEHCHSEGAAGITISGVFGDVRSNYLIEGNRISGAVRNGIEFGGQNGVTVRNNVLHDNGGVGISVSGDVDFVNHDVRIYNNSIYWNEAGGIDVGDSDGVIVRNNLVFDNSCRWRPNEGGGPRIAQITISDNCAHASSDYNLLSAPAPSFEGPHSVIVSDVDDEWLSDGDGLAVNLALRDLHLAPGSRAVDKGEDLSATGFASDFDGVSRPQGRGWDIGAYESQSPAK